MKAHFLYILTLLVFTVTSLANDSAPVTKADALSNPVIARSLADACDSVRLINDLNWKAVKKKLGDQNPFTLVIKEQSKLKDWHGIGAYRGSEVDTLNKQVKHRFSAGGRSSVHEIWITYDYSKDNFKNPKLTYLGW